jgi:hypothetical protein
MWKCCWLLPPPLRPDGPFVGSMPCSGCTRSWDRIDIIDLMFDAQAQKRGLARCRITKNLTFVMSSSICWSQCVASNDRPWPVIRPARPAAAAVIQLYSLRGCS